MQPGQTVGVRVDVAEPASIEALAQRALEAYGRIDVVCNNAGVVTLGTTWEQTLDDWRWVIGVDLWGVSHGVRAFVPLLIEQRQPAHVVNTACPDGDDSSNCTRLASPGIGRRQRSASATMIARCCAGASP